MLSLFRNESNKFNNTEVYIFEFVYYNTSKIFCNHASGVKTSVFCQIYIAMGVFSCRY